MSMTLFGNTTINGYEIQDAVDNNKDYVVFPYEQDKECLPEGAFARIVTGPEPENGAQPLYIALYTTENAFDALWAMPIEHTDDDFSRWITDYGHYTAEAENEMLNFLSDMAEKRYFDRDGNLQVSLDEIGVKKDIEDNLEI